MTMHYRSLAETLGPDMEPPEVSHTQECDEAGLEDCICEDRQPDPDARADEMREEGLI